MILEISHVAKFLVRWISIASLGLIVWLWAMRYPAAEAPPVLPPLPAATPATTLVPSQPSVLSEQPLSEQLITRKPPRPQPKPPRRVLQVAPPPPQPQARAQVVQPHLPPPAYPQAGRPLTPPPPPLAYNSSGPAAASLSPAAYVNRAEGASAQLDRLIRQGKLRAQFVGTGRAGEMVEMALENTTGQPLTVTLTPGMILRPPDGHQVQPLMLNEQVTMTLAPGTSTYRQLASYCMDSRVPAPFPYESVDYRFSPRTRDGGAETVRVFQVAQEIELESNMREAVTQIAIWKSLHQPVDDSRVRSAMGGAFYDTRLRAQVLRDVQRVLQKAR